MTVSAFDKYVEQLNLLVKGASTKQMLICIAWHGEKFGVPGWGGADFVAIQLERAQQAIKAIEEWEEIR